MQEVWKAVVGWEGYYEVSNMGRVRSLDREVISGDGSGIGKGNRRYHQDGRILRDGPDGKKGYRMVNLYRDGVCTKFSVHRLVATVFIPNPYHHPVVNHRNSTRNDNRVDNLEWTTAQGNVTHAMTHGNMDNRGERHGLSVLTDATVREIRKLVSSGCEQSEIARRLKVSKTTVHNVVRNRSWRHVE